LGLVEISTAASNPLLPKVYGTNDTHQPDISAPVYWASQFSSFNVAVSTIGSAIATLIVSTAQMTAATVSIPATLTLQFIGAGSLSVTTGNTVTVVGPIVASVRKIFFNATAGLGTVVFTNNRRVRTFYPEWWGAIGDGSTDCFAAIQAAEVAMESVKSGEMVFGSGSTAASYNVSAAVQISRVKGIKWKGNGPDNTRITATGGQPAVQTLGCWRSKFEGIYFTTSASISAKGVFELDGDGTQGVQGNTIERCYFNANQLAPYAFTVVRVGGSGAQGSENLYLNCNFDGATTACYYQNGFNALNNTFLGGNLQSYSKHGIQIVAGSVEVFSVGFQSTYQYTQIANSGFDIDASSSGVNERILVQGCRTESLQFYNGASSQLPILIGNYQSPSVSTWTALTGYSLNAVIIKNTTAGNKLFRVTTAGTSGAAEPSPWPPGGTQADGSVVWTVTNFLAVGSGGATTLINNYWTVGNIQQGNSASNGVANAIFLAANTREVTADYTANNDDEFLLVDATSGAVTVTLPFFNSAPGSVPPPVGKRYYVKKYDTSANTVTVQDDSGSGPDGAAYVIAGGSRGFVVAEMAGGGSLTRRYWIVSHS